MATRTALPSVVSPSYGVAVPDDTPPENAWPEEVANVVGRRVGHYRRLRGLTAQQLSDALQAIGVTMRRPVISNLENGYRGTVTVAEVIALGHVLNTPPLMLVFPLGTEHAFPLLPDLPYSPDAAEQWFTGGTGHPAPVVGADRELWVTETEQLTLLRQHRKLVGEWLRLQRILDGDDPASNNPRRVEFAADRAGEVETELQQVRRRIRRDDLEPVELPAGLAHLDAEGAL